MIKDKCNDLELQLKEANETIEKLRFELNHKPYDIKPDYDSEIMTRLKRIEEHLIRNDKLKKQKELKAKLDDTLYEMLGDSYDNGYYEGHR